MICQCCGNHIPATGGVTMYWLQGNKFVHSVCYVCWQKPYLLALFLHQKQDLTDKQIKEYGLRFGYTQEELKKELGGDKT